MNLYTLSVHVWPGNLINDLVPYPAVILELGTFSLWSVFHSFSSFLIFYLLQMLSPFCFTLSWSLITKQWVNYLSQSSWIYSYALWHSGNYQRLVECHAERFSPHRGAVHIFIMMLFGLRLILCTGRPQRCKDTTRQSISHSHFYDSYASLDHLLSSWINIYDSFSRELRATISLA